MADERSNPSRGISSYDRMIESTGLPIHTGYYMEDLRTLELGWWEARQCSAAFLQLTGQEGVTGACVTEIPPGKTLPPFKMAVDEVIYVVQGRGLTNVWADESPKKTFEWQKHSMFSIPANYSYQLCSVQGDQPARLLHCSYLPLAMSVIPNPDFFFKNPIVDLEVLYGESDFYSEAKTMSRGSDGRPISSPRGMDIWFGNFFPDMRAWDKLQPFRGRGAGGHAVWIGFPGSPLTAHMSVFPSRTYKKGHRHGPGFMIVIPVGEGYSVMWPEGGEKVVIPWHEASVFVPPNRWFHQHFNIGHAPARYLAIHPPRGLNGISEKVEDRARDQIEYPDEDPMIRKRFEDELAKRGLTSLMPKDAYQEAGFEWNYSA